MAESKSHKATANRISKKLKAQYNQGQGADINTNKMAIEVETEDTIGDASRQLAGYKKPVYVAATNKQALEKAIDHYANTTIGVMDKNGKIIKKSTRGN